MTLPNARASRSAQARIAPHIRRTPVIELVSSGGCRVLGKLECQQVTGSFKVRGALSHATALTAQQRAKGLIAASAGNHGAGVAYAGQRLGVAATVVVPMQTSEARAARIRALGGTVIFHGEDWDAANSFAREQAEREGSSYIHPFSDLEVIAGQGTLALELAEEVPKLDVVVAAVGGGGLLSGCLRVLRELSPQTRVYGVEPEGCANVRAALERGRPVELARVNTQATSLAPRSTTQLIVDALFDLDGIVTVSDEMMAKTAAQLFEENQLRVELAAGAALAAIRQGQLPLAPGETVAAVICGAADAPAPSRA